MQGYLSSTKLSYSNEKVDLIRRAWWWYIYLSDDQKKVTKKHEHNRKTPAEFQRERYMKNVE